MEFIALFKNFDTKNFAIEQKDFQKFDDDILKFLKGEFLNYLPTLKETGDYFLYDTSCITMYKVLQAVCKEEMHVVVTQHENAFSKNALLRELMHIIRESGFLIRPLLERLIFLQSLLMQYMKDKKKYTVVSMSLFHSLNMLITPNSSSGKNISLFLKQLRALKEILPAQVFTLIKRVLGSRKELFKTLRFWSKLSEDIPKKVNRQMSSWLTEVQQYCHINRFSHEWISPVKGDNPITWSEVQRCLVSDDNELIILPEKFTLNKTTLYDGKCAFKSKKEFLCDLLKRLYRKGFRLEQITSFQIQKDVEWILLANAPNDRVEKELKGLFLPLLKEEEEKGRLLEFCLGMNMKKERAEKFLEELSYDIENYRKNEPYLIEQLTSQVERLNSQLQVLSLCTISCWHHAHRFIQKLYPQIFEFPFRFAYDKGINVSVNIKSMKSFSVNLERKVKIYKEDKVVDEEDFFAMIPFSWTVKSRSKKQLAARLKIFGPLEFSKTALETEKWAFIEAILNWKQWDAEKDPTAPTLIPSPK